MTTVQKRPPGVDAGKKLLGSLIGSMIRILAARKHQRMGATMQDLADQLHMSKDAVYKWRAGDARPGDEHLTQLIAIGVREAGMDRGWVQRMIEVSQLSDGARLLSEFFPVSAPRVLHNLPRRPFGRHGFIGRAKEIAEIQARLSPECSDWAVCIEGASGVGKSALALRVAWDYVEDAELSENGRGFDAIIWTSAQQRMLTSVGIQEQPATSARLEDIYAAIGEVLGFEIVSRQAPDDAASRAQSVKRALQERGRVLIILDNFEEIENPRRVLAFVRTLPQSVKVIMTTRFREDVPFPLTLSGLDADSMLDFIRQQAANRGLLGQAGLLDDALTPHHNRPDTPLGDNHMRRLLASVQGIPLAAEWAIGLMAMRGYGAEATLAQIEDYHGDLCTYLFEEAMRRLKHVPDEGAAPAVWLDYEYRQTAYKALCALAFFDPTAGASFERICQLLSILFEERDDTAEDDGEADGKEKAWERVQLKVEQALRLLANYSLVMYHGRQEPCTMLPLARKFIQAAEMPRDPDWEWRLRERWVDQYKAFAARYGTPDHVNWSVEYNQLDREWLNLRAVCDWCVVNGRRDVLQFFWLGDVLGPYAEIYGRGHYMLYYLRYIRKAAESAGDYASVARALAAQCRCHAFKYALDVADDCLTELRKWQPYGDERTQCEIALNDIMIAARRVDTERGMAALARLRALISVPPEAEGEAGTAAGGEPVVAHDGSLTDELRQRYALQCWYYEGMLDFKEGMLQAKAQALADAKKAFERVRDQGRAIAWQRIVIHAILRLAQIALAQHQYRRARDLLAEGFAPLETNRDMLREAGYRATFAHLAKETGDNATAHREANEALGIYQRLGMSPQCEEMKRVLSYLGM